MRIGSSSLQNATLAGVLLALVLAWPSTGWPQTSNLKPDEDVVFFPSLGWTVDDGKEWELEIHGCVYELEQRPASLALLRAGLGLAHVQMTAEESATFKQRARLFMVDHERGKRIAIKLGDRTIVLPKSRADGQFYERLRLPRQEIERMRSASPRRLVFTAVLPAGDERKFPGQIHLLEDTGVTVVSDIDDTIKISCVADRSALLGNTFLKPFLPVPGMADLFSTWDRRAGAQFCYVSASPWQLFPPLCEMVASHGFPPGAFLLRDFRWKDESLLHLFQNPAAYKQAVIEPLLQRFPHRRFVLVGDSGESDPEIYAGVARAYPTQVQTILIRDVTGENAASPRYQETFKDVDRRVWKVFTDPSTAVQTRSAN